MDKRWDLFGIKDLIADVNDLATNEKQGEARMQKTGWMLMAALLMLTMAGCAPLIIGGAAAVVADEAVEQDKGGDGLF